MSSETLSAVSTAARLDGRRIVQPTAGRDHGPITRLMSPSDLGEQLKPFVFLDRFTAPAAFVGAMPIHPHSGIATITVLTEGNARFDDSEAGHGTIDYGGVEWMRAGNGVWHGKEMSAGTSATVAGFQLWIALPPELENAIPDSQYVESAGIPAIGPARLVLGSYAGMQSPVRAPADINYLMVSLNEGEHWRYDTPVGHDVIWTAVASGALTGSPPVKAGELAIFGAGTGAIDFEAAAGGKTVFVLGSAVAHPHDLVLGHYSVHTSTDALAAGETQIARLGSTLGDAGDRRRGGGTPVYR